MLSRKNGQRAVAVDAAAITQLRAGAVGCVGGGRSRRAPGSLAGFLFLLAVCHRRMSVGRSVPTQNLSDRPENPTPKLRVGRENPKTPEENNEAGDGRAKQPRGHRARTAARPAPPASSRRPSPTPVWGFRPQDSDGRPRALQQQQSKWIFRNGAGPPVVAAGGADAAGELPCHCLQRSSWRTWCLYMLARQAFNHRRPHTSA